MEKLKSKWVDPSTNIVLIDEEGNNLGVKTFKDAMKLGFSKDTKMIKVNENEEGVMIYRIMNLEKMKKKKKKIDTTNDTDFKEIRLSMMISDHDVEVKEKKMMQLLRSGYTVKVIVFQKKTKEINFEQELCVAIIKNLLERVDKKIASYQNIQVENKKQEAFTFVVPFQQREKKPKKRYSNNSNKYTYYNDPEDHN